MNQMPRGRPPCEGITLFIYNKKEWQVLHAQTYLINLTFLYSKIWQNSHFCPFSEGTPLPKLLIKLLLDTPRQ